MSERPQPVRTGQVEIRGRPIEYEVIRSADATEPRIDVDIHGVRVVLPERSGEDPETLLLDNGNWVIEKTGKYDRYRSQAPDRNFEPGAVFPYLGEDHEVVVERRSNSQVTEDTLRLAEHHVKQTSVRRALKRLFQREARRRFESRAASFANEMDVTYEAVELRNQRTLWGSCSTSGTLSLNWRLIMAPPSVIDYVIVHELAHLIEQNHTRRFWDIVGDAMPEYSTHVEWLEDNSARLIFSEDDL